MAKLTLISDTVDRELATIRRTVGAFEAVSGEPAVVEVLRKRVAAGQLVETLDLVGHSAEHGFLRIGDWSLDDSPQTAGSFDLLIRPSLEALGVREVRLLGCVTAMSMRSWTAITNIARAARCRVYGTRRYIGSNDYRPQGFISDDALVGTPGPRPERQDRIGLLPHAATHTPIESLAMSAGPVLAKDQAILPVNVEVAHKMLSCIKGDRSWLVPGLLSASRPTVLWSTANTIHRLDVLLDGEAVRAYGAYPDDEHGRIYLVREPGKLNHLIEHPDRPRIETQARTT